MSETLWGVDLVQSLLPLPELTCSWLGGICVGMCIGMDASRAVTQLWGRIACCDTAVGKVGHVVVVVCERASPHRVSSRVPRCHRVCVLPC